MDRIERLLQEVRKDPSIMKYRYTTAFLNAAANFFDKYGVGGTRVFLMEKLQRGESQANGILNLFKRFDEYPEVKNNRIMGRLFIKSLITIKTKKEV